MADLHKFTSKEILNKVLVGASKVGVTAYQLSEVLSLVFDEANVALRVSLDGGTPTVDAITIAEGTVPDTPDTGYAVIWFDTSDNHLKTIDDTGATVDLTVGLAADLVKTDTPGTPDAGSIRLSFDSDNIPHATDENGDEVLFTVIPSESGSIGSVAVVDSVQSKLYLQAFAKTFDKNVLLRVVDAATTAFGDSDYYGNPKAVPIGDTALLIARVSANTLDAGLFRPTSSTSGATFSAVTDLFFDFTETGVKYAIEAVSAYGTTGLIRANTTASSGSVSWEGEIFNLTALGTYTAEQVLALASLGVTVTTSDSWEDIASATGYSADIWDILIPSHVSSMEPTIVSSLVNRGGNLAYIGGGIKNPSYSGSGSFHDIADAYGLIDDGFYVFSNSTASNKGVSFEPWYVNPNTAYICSANYDAEESSNLKISEFDCDGNYLAQTTILSAISGTGSGSATFTTNSRTAYIKLSGLVNSSAEGTSKFTNIQLNEGSTANTYSAPLNSPFTVGSRSVNQLRNGNGEEGTSNWVASLSGGTFVHNGTEFVLTRVSGYQTVTKEILTGEPCTLFVNGKYTTTQGNLKLTNYQNGAVSDFDVTPSGWTRLSEGVYELAFTTSFADSIAVITNSDYIQLLYEGESGAGSVSWKNNMLVKGEYTLAQLQALGYVSYEPVTLLSCQNNAQTSTVRDRIYGQGDKIWLEHNVQTVSGFKYGDPEIDTTDLVTNGDMEAGLATVNGQSFTGFQTTRTQSTDEAHAGSNSFKNVLTGSAGNTYVIPNNSALNGKKVRKTGWVYIPSANTSLVEVEIRARIDGSDSILDTITTLDAWTYFDVSYVRGSTPATDRDFIFNAGTATSGDIFYFDDIEEYQFNIQENLAPTLEDITEFCNGSLGQPADQGQNHIVAEGGVELGIVHYLGVGAVTKDLSEALQTKANKTDVPVPRFLSVTRENASAGTGNLVYQFSDMAGFADYYENIDGQGYTLGTNVSDIILFPNAVVFVKSAGVASGEFLGSVTVSSAEAPYFYTGD